MRTTTNLLYKDGQPAYLRIKNNKEGFYFYIGLALIKKRDPKEYKRLITHFAKEPKIHATHRAMIECRTTLSK